MTASMRQQPAPTRQEFADRLLKGSVKKSYAPVVDIDWDAPLDPDKFFLPPESVSLYGTPMWDAMTREQQIELSRQELVNTLSAGIWFENILNQALLRKIMHQDPTARSTHYELTELGDETRHMVMFGKAIEHVGAKPVQPRWWHRVIINALPLGFKGSVLWAAALIGEEIFDSIQRRMMDDPELQPMVQRLMRIHVTEEARHIQFARDGLRKRTPTMGRPVRLWVSNINGLGGYFFRYLFTSKIPYLRVGLDAERATAARQDQPAPPRGSDRGVRSAGRVPRRGRADGADRASVVAAHRLPAAMSACARADSTDERLREEPTAPMTAEHCHDVVVAGVDRAEQRLAQAGITDIAVVDTGDLSDAAFDEATHTWSLPTCRAKVIVTNQIRSGREDLAPYLGIAVHGVPNYFMVDGADAVADARLDYIARVSQADATHRQHPHRGAVQHPARVRPPRSRQSRPGGCVVLATDGEGCADVIRPELGHRRRRRDLRWRRDDPYRRR